MSLYPPRGTVKGGTPLLIHVNNFPHNSSTYSPQCKFSYDLKQQGQSFVSTALTYNSTHAVCLTPDISGSFNSYINAFQDTYVTINDLDGVFRQHTSLLYTFVREYGLTHTVPPYTYMKQRQTITFKGFNLLNEYSLMVRMRLEGSGSDIIFQQHLLYIDEETLLIQMPWVENLKFQRTRTATFYVSLNGGVDWSPQSADFMFYEEPQMTRLSQYM